MYLSARFVNCLRILSGGDDVEPLIESWAPHIVFVEKIDLSWARFVPELDFAMQPLLALENTRLVLFRDFSAVVAGVNGDTNVAVEISAEDMKHPGTLAIFYTSSAKLQKAVQPD